MNYQDFIYTNLQNYINKSNSKLEIGTKNYESISGHNFDVDVDVDCMKEYAEVIAKQLVDFDIYISEKSLYEKISEFVYYFLKDATLKNFKKYYDVHINEYFLKKGSNLKFMNNFFKNLYESGLINFELYQKIILYMNFLE